MKKTLQIINRMHNEGLFCKYAIGGGIASLFYSDDLLNKIVNKHGISTAQAQKQKPGEELPQVWKI